MKTVIIELFVIALLILVNAFFACAEFAVISIRKSRVAQLVAAGDKRAQIIEALQKDPHRLLAVAQIGMTVVGATASALGGVVAVTHLKPILLDSSVEFIRRGAEPISVSFVVIVLSYFILVVGELAPKAIGLQYADPAALHFARPLDIFARICGVVVSILSYSSRSVLKIFGIQGREQGFISREEIQYIVSEGHEAGTFTAAENEYIKNIFDFTHTTAREVMVPRTRMAAVDLEKTKEDIFAIILESQYTRYPVYRGDIEEIAGFIHAKDFLAQMVKDSSFDIQSIVRSAFYVPEGKKVNELLKEMQRKRVHLALVIDEYGGLSGMVTTEDLLEELVGEIEDEHDEGEPLRIQHAGDGSYVVDALLSINDLEDLLEVSFGEDLQFDTVAGIILQSLGRFPEKGEAVEWSGYHFGCVEVAKNSIVRVSVKRSVN
ncbi:MAG: HlyC/CorC family transporter [Geobacteraceae bacterium]|nr:HlyC/CorC family transporter [Geobacteraceae bacterium]